MIAKKHATLYGTLLSELEVGSSAMIASGGQYIRTSTIVAIKSLSPGCVCFETLNTHYTLLPEPVSQEVAIPFLMGMAA